MSTKEFHTLQRYAMKMFNDLDDRPHQVLPQPETIREQIRPGTRVLDTE
jgi:hypothetical protein